VNSILRCALFLFVSLTGALAVSGWAQNYPARPVRLIVSFSAGSGTDTVGRLLAGGLSEALHQQVIVDNRAGAAGNIGAELAAKSPPDGYTLFFNNISYAANISLFRKLPFDLLRDFAPISQVATGPYIVSVHPSLPVKTFGDFVKLGKAKPGAILYSSGGTGTATFLAAELYKSMAGVDLMHVPYKSGAEAITALVGGEVSVHFAPLATATPYIQQNRVRALAVSTAKRLQLYPQVPTIAESGYPRYEFGNWYGLEAPARTPRDIIQKLHDATVTALANPSVVQRMGNLGYIIVTSEPDEFGAYMKSEVDKLGKLIKTLNLPVE
jgi:tripartite-type tricarboxylate transporter receptor subunit TctC